MQRSLSNREEKESRFGNTRTLARLYRIGRGGTQAFLDFGVLFGALAWAAWFAAYSFWFSILFAVALRWKKVRRFLPARIFFGFFCFLFIDSVVLGLFPLYCVSKFAWVVAILLSVGGICLVIKKRRLSFRFLAYSFVPAVIINVFFVGGANKTLTEEDCAVAGSEKEVEVLVDLPSLGQSRGLPRYMIARPDRNDFIITYRSFGFGHEMPEVFGDRFDPLTRKVEPFITDSEVIGLYYDEKSGELITANVNRSDSEHPKTLQLYDSNLDRIEMIDFPSGGKDDYSAYFVPYDNKLLILTEGAYFFSRNTLEIESADEAVRDSYGGCELWAETSFRRLSESRFVLAGGGFPILYLLLPPIMGVCSVDLAAKAYQGYRAPIGGAWDIDYVPDRDELIMTSFWRDKVSVASADDLRHLRTFKLGPCVRPLAYNPQNHYGYALESFTGNLLIFDVVSGKIKRRLYLGKNGRKLYYFKDLGMVALTGCGVFRILEERPGKEYGQ